MAIFQNRATLSYRGVTASSNTVTGEIESALTVLKTALEENYFADSSVTYVISLVNSGESELTGLTVTDDLGMAAGAQGAPLSYVPDSAALFIDGTPSKDLGTETGSGLVFTGITVPANGSSVIVYKASVTGFAPLGVGGTVTNTAAVNGGVSPVSASASISAAETPVLSVTKALTPLTVSENGTVTYTFTIENCGNLPAEEEDGTMLEDVFDPALTDLSAELNGTPMTSPADYSYDASTGVFSTVPGFITVPAAEFTAAPDGAVVTVPGKTVLTVKGNIGNA